MLGNTVYERSDYRDMSPSSREDSASLGHEESKHAIELLQNGEAVPCPRCETADEVRTSNGMRSRGVGRMKVDIVLYGGQNEGAERVGQCLQRDILGLRDPNEPPVPESAAETRARERKEKKEADKLKLEQQQQLLAVKVENNQAKGDTSIDSEVAIDSELGAFMSTEDSKDDILARAFAEEGDDSARSSVGPSILSSQPASSGRSVTIAEPIMPPKKKPQRPARLKPLPPDLLIVAGTSLKVPGTKRIVREFAKACHAQDEWLIYSSEEEDESSTAEDGPGKKRSKDAKANGDAASKPKKNRGAANGEETDEDADEDEEHEIHDPATPIRTILLNYDFPNPAREWEDVFDVWIQGDLQRAALSLFPRKQIDQDAPVDAKAIEEIVSSYTWAKFKDYLEEQRKLVKKEKKKAAVAATAGSLGARKGRLGRTVSAAAKMERTGTQSFASSTPPLLASSQAEKGTAASKAKEAKARARSLSPVKKPRANAAASGEAGAKRAGAKGGLKRSNSKKNPFLANQDASSVVSVDIPTIVEEEDVKQVQGKGRDGGTKAKKRKELPSSLNNNDAPSSKRNGWSRSATMPESELVVLIDSQAANRNGPVKEKPAMKKGTSVKDVGVGVKPSTVYGKGRGKRSSSVSVAGKEGRKSWGRTQSETAACL